MSVGGILGYLSAASARAAQFVARAEGSMAAVFAIALIPIMIAVGGAVDYARANNFKSALQSALDAAVLAGARDASSNWTQVATNVFQSVLNLKFGATATTPSFDLASSGVYAGSVTGSVPTAFLSIVRLSAIPVSVTATAQAVAPDNSCILTLDHGQPPSHTSLSLNGAPVVNLSGCSIRSNSAIDCNGHDGNNTSAIAAGVAADCTHPSSYAAVVPDVYASLAANIQTQCAGLRPGVVWTADLIPSGPGVITVNLGSYVEYHICGDLTLSGNGYLTGSSPMSDSVIVVENGSINIANGADISTRRTAVVMTGNNSYPSAINFPNGNGNSASLSLSAPTGNTNLWQGVALYQDPRLTYQVDNRWGPGASLNADGLVYLGNSNVVTDGNTGSYNSQCSKYVMNSFTTNGRVNLDLQQQASACSAIGLKQWNGIVVHLTR